MSSDCIEPPAPTVEVDEPTRILCPAFCATFHRPAPLPATRTMSPTAAMLGSVIVTRPPLLAM